jgi:hypothetical protein
MDKEGIKHNIKKTGHKRRRDMTRKKQGHRKEVEEQ